MKKIIVVVPFRYNKPILNRIVVCENEEIAQCHAEKYEVNEYDTKQIEVDYFEESDL